MTPLALTDTDTWRTEVRYLNGRLVQFKGRCTNIASIPLGLESGLSEIRSFKLPVRINKPKQTNMPACHLQPGHIVHSSLPKPVRRYTIHFDGQTKPVTLDADT